MFPAGGVSVSLVVLIPWRFSSPALLSGLCCSTQSKHASPLCALRLHCPSMQVALTGKVNILQYKYLNFCFQGLEKMILKLKARITWEVCSKADSCTSCPKDGFRRSEMFLGISVFRRFWEIVGPGQGCLF